MTDGHAYQKLALAADVMDDLERVRIANENRLRQFTRPLDQEDEDGEYRGFGLDESDPDVARLAALVEMLVKAEAAATANLETIMKKHPLGPWVRSMKGVGAKQAARLVASIGDPYWKTTSDEDRPRLVSELWSYCGYGDPVKQVKRAGVKAAWNHDAKMRAFNVSKSCLKQLRGPCHVIKDDKGAYKGSVHVEGECECSPYRLVYDAARTKYDGAVHVAECKRCGPAGKPAQPGSPISAAHQQGRALHAVSKAILKDLWKEAKRLHEVAE